MAATRIELPEQLEAYIQFKIETGLYSNGAEVIRDALRHMMQEDDEATRALRLREAVALGFEQIERGEGAEYRPETMQQMKESARARARQGQKPKADVVA
jgi:putative addiction module CopG family antidote